MSPKLPRTILMFLLASAAASAGTIAWPEGVGVILSHPPNRHGGSASDTAFLDDFGSPVWQQLADDFVLLESAVLRRVSWHGFYGGTFDPPPPEPPPSTEVMRVRLYDARPSDGLPGDVLFEESFNNPLRIATGHYIILNTGHPEYVFQVDLVTPYELAANQQYWLEIAQVGDPDSHFRWEDSSVGNDIFAFVNPLVADWTLPVNTPIDLSFELSSIPEVTSLVYLVLTLVLLLSFRGKGGARSRKA